MRRKRARLMFWVLAAGSAAMALFAPRPARVQATAGLLVAPVSYPSHRAGGWLADRLSGAPPLDPGSPDDPRSVQDLSAENEKLRQRLIYVQGQLDGLRQLHEDRRRVGESLLPRTTAAGVVGVDGDVLHVAGTGLGEAEAGQVALHYGAVRAGVAGVVSQVGVGAAEVRLISDPSVRVEGRFVRFVTEPGGALRETVLEIDKPLLEGAGQGMCQVARVRSEQIAKAKLASGDWIVLDDDKLAPELRFFRLGEVHAIEPLPDAPGFERVLVRPAVELRQLKEVMILVR